MMCPDCSPPSAQPRRTQLGEHVAVADRSGRHLDAGVAHRAVEAVVRHHGHGDAVAGQTPVLAQMQGDQRHQLVAVDYDPVAVDGEDAVAVAVEGEARVVPVHALGQLLDVSRAAVQVDVAAVGLRPPRRPRPPPGGGRSRGRRRRWPRSHSRAGCACPTGRGRGSAARARAGSRRARRAALARDRCCLRRPRVRRLDPLLLVVVELHALGAEELDPVVLVRVVRRRYDRRHVEAVAPHEHRRARRGQHAAQQRMTAARRDAGRERGLEHLARLARVADDQDLGRMGRGDLCCRPPQPQSEVGGQELARDPADAVRAEEGHGRSSASRTAAACGPS